MSGNQPVVLVSSCGTSLLTSFATDELRHQLTRLANKSAKGLSPDEKRLIDDCVARAKEKLLGAEDLSAVRKLSAELNGVISFYQGEMTRGRRDQHYLIHTDTYQGHRVVKVLREWLTARGVTCTPVPARDLNTASLLAFTSGVQEIIRWCQDTLPGYRDSGSRIVFNLTGGFKSLQGFLQTIGAFYADEIVYIFESSQELLRIPRLPVKLDIRDAVEKDLQAFRLLGMNYELDADRCSGIPETLLTKMDDKAVFSVWGDLVWKQIRKDIYGESLQEPLSRRLKYSARFMKDAAGLPTDRMFIVNKQLDDLSRCIDENTLHDGPGSLRFKALEGNPVPGSTHEFYAWSDKDAKRAFGHFEAGEDGRIFVIDKLDSHL
ncbi:MAG: putative CRISPR-associated protein [Desulfomonilaceae bacterium]|nr:putative CRISPR-associated protein [Desulfomonilaceae bacterium]